jgi:hypothetical protein
VRVEVVVVILDEFLLELVSLYIFGFDVGIRFIMQRIPNTVNA